VRRETESGRVAAIGAVLAAMQPQIADRALTDVVLTGDFNAPSHLDWTEATRAQHCDIGAVAWPVEQAGLVDTYRAVHADPAADAGNTWSPIRPDHREAEPQDRNCYPEYLYTTANSCIDENRSDVSGQVNLSQGKCLGCFRAFAVDFYEDPHPAEPIAATTFDGQRKLSRTAVSVRRDDEQKAINARATACSTRD